MTAIVLHFRRCTEIVPKECPEQGEMTTVEVMFDLVTPI
jgi:hypothetical protein